MRDAALDTLLLGVAGTLATDPRPEAGAAAHALITTQIPAAFPPARPCGHDAAIRALLADSPHPLAPALAAMTHRIPWGASPVEGALGALAAIFATAELLAPEGPIPAPDLRVGLFYQAPGSWYPPHRHVAAETYYILAGGALWTAGEDTRPRGTGAVIHHPSMMPHAFRTGPEGLLALWRWSGDVSPESYEFIEMPGADIA